MKFIFRYLRKLIIRFRVKWYKNKGKQIIHVFHIGKTGGTALKHALGDTLITKKYAIFTHDHEYRFEDSLPGEKIVFFVRDPIERFISGFYSRKRKDEPRYYIPWTKGEAKAFKYFDTPNKLAIALSSKDKKSKRTALSAMKSIYHVKSSYWDWFKSRSYFNSRLDDVLFVGKTRNLTDDFERLKKVLNLPSNLSLPQTDQEMHKNPKDSIVHLKNTARENLVNWYKSEYDFIDLLSKNELI